MKTPKSRPADRHPVRRSREAPDVCEIGDQTGPGTYWPLAFAIGLFVLTLLTYSPAIHGDFIWDDDQYVEHNETLRDWTGLRNIWLCPRCLPQYYPLVHTTFWIEYQISGLSTTTYHFTNVALHALNAFLIWKVLSRLSVPGAWFAAALFAIHPVHVESVAWITERKNVLSGTFYLASMLAYLIFNATFDAAPRRQWKYYGLSLAFYVGALLSKTVTASLPAALLVIAWWKRGTITRREFLTVLPLFAIGIPFGVATAWLEKHHVGAAGLDWDYSFVARLLIASRACWFYFGKLLVPIDLAFIYPRWSIDTAALWQYAYLVGAVAFVAALWNRRNRLGRGPIAGVLFFGGTLSPALGFINVYPHRYSFVADHFQYLASIGILAILAASLTTIANKLTRQRVCVAISVGIVSVLAILSWKQCWIYSDRETLWRDTCQKNPDSVIAHTNLADFYLSNGRIDEAIPSIRRSLELAPNDAETNNNMGIAYHHLRQLEQAVHHLRTAISANPNYAEAYGNLGAVLTDLNDLDGAMKALRKAIELNGRAPEHHFNLGRTLMKLGRESEAQASFAEAKRLSDQ